MTTILVIEDELAIADMLQAVLEEEGYQVVLANNGREGLARLADTHLDLVLCDVMMPVMDGREVFRQIHNNPELNSIPVILMSAGNPHINQDGVPIPFLPKPFDLSQLLDIVEQYLKPSA